jgi:hypothetical protein
MSLAAIIQSAQFLTISGQQVVVLEQGVWQEIVDWLEDLEDAAELEQARQEDDENISWDQVKADYADRHPQI